jgi:hypothetical protein
MENFFRNDNKYLINITFYGNMLFSMITWSFTFTLFYMIYLNVFLIRRNRNNYDYKLLYQFLNFGSYLIGLYLFLHFNILLYNLIIICELLLITLFSLKLFNFDYDGLLLLICENIVIAITILLAVIFSNLCNPKLIELY